MQRKAKGFTLVELLLVIGIIATLAVVAFVALDPAKRFADARDARRVSDVETILSAVHQYIIDNKGEIPAGISTNEQQLGYGNGGCELGFGACVGAGTMRCLNLAGSLEHYLKTMPYDPNNGSLGQTHYSIKMDVNNIITVTACDAEGGSEISVSR